VERKKGQRRWGKRGENSFGWRGSKMRDWETRRKEKRAIVFSVGNAAFIFRGPQGGRNGSGFWIAVLGGGSWLMRKVSDLSNSPRHNNGKTVRFGAERLKAA